MQHQPVSATILLNDAGCRLLAGIISRDIASLIVHESSDTADVVSDQNHSATDDRAECITEYKALDDGSCVRTCQPIGDEISTGELCLNFTPHARSMADEFARMVAFADLFAAGYEAEAISPEHDAAFRTWLVAVSPAVERFTADLARLNRRLALDL